MGKWVRRILSAFVPGVPAPEDEDSDVSKIVKPSLLLKNPDDLRKYGLS